MNIDLNPEQQNFIARLLDSGVFARGEDVLAAGLEELRQKQARLAQQREIFAREIAPALRQLDEGAGRAIEIEAFLTQQKNA